MVLNLDLTAAELVTAYVLYESVLVANNRKCATVCCVRLLMTACISLAVKTVTDAIITTNLIAAIVRDSGFQLEEKQLAEHRSRGGAHRNQGSLSGVALALQCNAGGC